MVLTSRLWEGRPEETVPQRHRRGLGDRMCTRGERGHCGEGAIGCIAQSWPLDFFLLFHIRLSS